MQEVTIQIWMSKIRRCQTDTELRRTILELAAQVLKDASKVAWNHKVPQVTDGDYKHNMACQNISGQLLKQEEKYQAAAEKLK